MRSRATWLCVDGEAVDADEIERLWCRVLLFEVELDGLADTHHQILERARLRVAQKSGVRSVTP